MIASLVIIVGISSIPVITYADDINNNTINTESSDTETKYEIDSEKNWLTEEVAKQLGKSGETLTENDFKLIKKIDLNGTKIDDKFPEEIILLRNLEYLNLNDTKIYGDIPESLGGLNKLTYIDLGDNKLKIGRASCRERV